MHDKIKQQAEEAGFQLWGDEDWNPGDVIDWSCRYDEELEKFADLLIQRCVAEVALMGMTHWENPDISWACSVIIKNIKDMYGKSDT